MCSVEHHLPPPPPFPPPLDDERPPQLTESPSNGISCAVEEEEIPMADGVRKECPHRAKKKLVNWADVKKKLRTNGKKGCETCEREPVKSSSSSPSGLHLCLSCGTQLCASHVDKHLKAGRSGDPHPFYYQLQSDIVKCEQCDVVLTAEDSSPSDAVLSIVSNIRSQTKNKEKEAAKNGFSKPIVDGKPPEKNEKTLKNGDTSAATVSIPMKAAAENGKDAKALPENDDDSKVEKKEKNGLNGLLSNGKKALYKESNGKVKDQQSSSADWGPDRIIAAKGLSNLGNTCFFNSVMQCMMHSHHLQYYFERFGRVSELSFREPVPVVIVNDEKIKLEAVTLAICEEPAPINDALREFLNAFRHDRSPSPNHLFNQIAEKARRFRSMAQQDAHELLRYLLDGLCSEETSRYQKAISTHLGFPVKATVKPDPELAKQAKAYLQLAGRPLLDVVFGGKLLQTIRCCECGHVSERYENFLDLSVPLAGGSSGGGGSRRSHAGADAASGTQTRKPSKHMQKKERAEAKRNSRKAARGKNSRRASEASEGTDKGQEAIEELMQEARISSGSEDEAEQDDIVQEEDEEKVVDRLDFTKVLAPLPAGMASTSERSVAASLLEFTAEEKLEGANRYECTKCCAPRNKEMKATGAAKKRVDALKRYLIVSPPAVLTIHLKRFQQVHMGMRMISRKVSGHVRFPVLFDVAPFCCKNVERVAPGQTRVLYSLYGVVSHSGDLGGGHYVAYVKSRTRIPQAQAFLEAARTGCADVHRQAATEQPLTSALQTPPTVDDLPTGNWYFCSDSRVSAVSESKVLGVEAYILFYERVY